MHKRNIKYIVFSDTYQGIKKILKNNDKNILKIKTFSPYILTKYKNNKKFICPLDQKKIKKLNYLKKSYASEIFNFLKENNLSHLSNYAVCVFCNMEKLFSKALSLENEDFKKRIIIQKVKGTGNDPMFNTPIDNFLDTKKFEIQNYYLKDDNNYFLNENRFDTLKIQSFKTTIYYLLKRLNILKLFLSNKKKVILLHETFAIRETVMSLIKYGYNFELYTPKDIKNKNSVAKSLYNPELKKIFYNFLNKLLGNNRVKKQCKDFLYNEFIKKINDHLSYEIVWERFFKKHNKPKAIFLGSPKNHIYTSLKHITHKLKIPLIAFQHGITYEVLDSFFVEHTQPTLDSCFSDYFFCFSKASKYFYQNKFSVSKCIPVGIPREISNRVLLPFTSKKSKNLTYVSSNLYAGNVNSTLQKNQNDYDIAKEETELFAKGLCHVKHKIFFQSYPKAPRYIDPDPIIEFLKKFKRIEIFDNNKDLKFARQRPTIFLTKTISSSLGYILLSERPVVLFNYDSKPLKKELQNKFKKIIFFFDKKKNNFFNEIIKFLNQPLSLIDKEWNKKRVERKKFISNYLGINDGLMGVRTAEIINRVINN